MKNIAMKLLVASTVVLTSACSGAGFPSLLGSDSAGNGNIVVRSGSYEDAKGANTGTFVGQNPADGDDALGGSFVADGYEAVVSKAATDESLAEYTVQKAQ